MSADPTLPQAKLTPRTPPADGDGIAQPLLPPAPIAVALSDPGRVRETNQDFAAAAPVPGCDGWLLLAVADGVGGHARGEWASARAVETVSAQVAALLPAVADPGAVLPAALAEANRVLFAEGSPDARGATTFVAALVHGNQAWWANVGDSRLYCIAGADARQVSADHSWVAEQVRSGRLTREQAATSPHRNVITRSIGFEPTVTVDSGGPLALAPGAVLVLCSDGLHGQLTLDEAAGIAIAHEPGTAAAMLVGMANERGGPDNVSVVICRLPGQSAAPAEPPAVTVESATVDAPPQAADRNRGRRRWSWFAVGVGLLLMGSAFVLATGPGL